MSDTYQLAQSNICFCHRTIIATRTVVAGRGVTLGVLIPKYLSGLFKKRIYLKYLISSCFQIKTLFSVIAKKLLKFYIMLKQLIDLTLWTSRVLCLAMPLNNLPKGW